MKTCQINILRLPLFLLFTFTHSQKAIPDALTEPATPTRNRLKLCLLPPHPDALRNTVQETLANFHSNQDDRRVERNGRTARYAKTRSCYYTNLLLQKFRVPRHNFLRNKQEALRNRYTMLAELLRAGCLPLPSPPPPSYNCTSKFPSAGRNEEKLKMRAGARVMKHQIFTKTEE